MRNLNQFFKNKKINFQELLDYGFKPQGNLYIYEENIVNNHFKVIIEMNEEIQRSKVIDTNLDEEYILVDVQDVQGSFVNKIKTEYERILSNILDKYKSFSIFESNQTQEIVNYVKKKYNDNLEFLWKNTPKNAIWRNQINKKWYGLILTISENKLGIKSNKTVEILNLKFLKNQTEQIVDNKKIFPGYHMNKKSWITIKLDGSVALEEIYKLIDNSYQLSINKK